MSDDDHAAALRDLAELSAPLAHARAALAPFDRDADELVDLSREHVASVLERVQRGELSAEEASEWADSVHLRDDLGREEGADDAINQALVEMSSPELFGDLTEIAPALLALLRGA